MNSNLTGYISTISIVLLFLTGCEKKSDNYPDPVDNPESSLMLAGDWVPDNTHQINFDALPRVPAEHIVISDVGETDLMKRRQDGERKGGENQHNYLTYYDGRFWIMWSDGPAIEARVGTVVKYATSEDGVNWSNPKFLTPYPPKSGPNSPHYGERSSKGLRYMARGFWVRNGELLALASLDEAAGFFGPSLELRAFRWNKENDSWEDYGQVYDNAINNFPPKQLPTGEWMTSRRSYDYKERGVDFMVGGVEAFDQWETYPVLGSNTELDAEEPYWWILPDGENLIALFRDNRDSGYLYRSFSTDNGRTWNRPIKTNFSDARSKFHGLRLSDGRYVLVSNSHPNSRNYLTLAISDDGKVFTKMFYLVGGRWVDYPHIMEHDGYLYIAHSGGKQSVEIQRVSLKDLNRLEMPPLEEIIKKN